MEESSTEGAEPRVDGDEQQQKHEDTSDRISLPNSLRPDFGHYDKSSPTSSEISWAIDIDPLFYWDDRQSIHAQEIDDCLLNAIDESNYQLWNLILARKRRDLSD